MIIKNEDKVTVITNLSNILDTATPTLSTPLDISTPTLSTPLDTSTPTLSTPLDTSTPTLSTPLDTSTPTLSTPGQQTESVSAANNPTAQPCQNKPSAPLPCSGASDCILHGTNYSQNADHGTEHPKHRDGTVDQPSRTRTPQLAICTSRTISDLDAWDDQEGILNQDRKCSSNNELRYRKSVKSHCNTSTNLDTESLSAAPKIMPSFPTVVSVSKKDCTHIISSMDATVSLHSTGGTVFYSLEQLQSRGSEQAQNICLRDSLNDVNEANDQFKKSTDLLSSEPEHPGRKCDLSVVLTAGIGKIPACIIIKNMSAHNSNVSARPSSTTPARHSITSPHPSTAATLLITAGRCLKTSGRPPLLRGHASCHAPPCHWLIGTAWALVLLLCAGVAVGEIDYSEGVAFTGGIRNETVTLGRDASLSCTVNNLRNHKVGWIHLKRQMIVAVHTRMITRISRYSVTHEDNKTWTLHINNVREEDRGFYMCQLNTKPALSQVGYLRVVVPPTIIDANSSDSEIQVREKKNVTLRCTGRGRPPPRLMWRREDNSMIVPDDRHPVNRIDGEVLELSSVSRTHMGSYLCIASNGVPPSVSKRITLKVEFPPQIHVPNQLVGVPTGDNVTIDCHVEAFPQAISYWVRDKVMVMNGAKYKTETIRSLYKIDMRLTVFNFAADDTRTYKCVAKNSLGETEGDIRLNEIYTPPKINEIKTHGESKKDNFLGGTRSGGRLADSGGTVGRAAISAEEDLFNTRDVPDLTREVNYYEESAVPQSGFPYQPDFPFSSGASSVGPTALLSLLPAIATGGALLAGLRAISLHLLPVVAAAHPIVVVALVNTWSR